MATALLISLLPAPREADPLKLVYRGPTPREPLRPASSEPGAFVIDLIMSGGAPPCREVTVSQVPSKIGPYKVLRPLGGGGFSEVFLGQDTRTFGPAPFVALKRVRPDLATVDPMYRRSIVLEGKVAGAMDIPNFARVSEMFAERGEPVVVMEYVEGVGLDRVLRHVARKGVPAAYVAEIGRQLANGLHALHTAGMTGKLAGEPLGYVHQDLKPCNIRLTPEGVVKVLDLGIAVPIEQPLTRVRQGTPGYRSPEQVRGDRRLGPASDLYALGIVLFELAVGRRLFPERLCHDNELLLRAQADLSSRLDKVEAAIPGGLRPILDALLAFEVRDRLQSGRDLEGLLVRWRNEQGGAPRFVDWAKKMASQVDDEPAPPALAAEPALSASAASAFTEDGSDATREGTRTPWRESRWLLLATSALLAAVFLGGLYLGVTSHPEDFGSIPPPPATVLRPPTEPTKVISVQSALEQKPAPKRTARP